MRLSLEVSLLDGLLLLLFLLLFPAHDSLISPLHRKEVNRDVCIVVVHGTGRLALYNL